jgi:hypothetical protein
VVGCVVVFIEVVAGVVVFSEANIDDCDSKPCVHGNCTGGVNDYTCDCHIGFTGSECETNIDDCHNKP